MTVGTIDRPMPVALGKSCYSWAMSLRSTLLAEGPGWSATDVVCTARPGDPTYEERYETACIAAVMEGTFQHRSPRGAVTLAPGALLLGNHGEAFECGHEHGAGDRCLAFNFDPAHLERTAAGVPGAKGARFKASRVPPVEVLLPLIVAAEAAREEHDGATLEELALRIAGTAIALADDALPVRAAPSARDERRVSEAVRLIEEGVGKAQSLASLASDVAMSPYHFLRTFRALVGMTPHQYVLRTRLHRAAVRLKRSDDPVSAIAFEEGFGDLSTFNRRFKRVMGKTPLAYRARAPGRACDVSQART